MSASQGPVRKVLALLLCLALALPAAAVPVSTAQGQEDGLEVNPLLQALLPDLKVEHADIVPGRAAVQVRVANLGIGPSGPGGSVTVSSRLSRQTGNAALPPLLPGQRHSLVVVLPVDPAILPPGARPDGTQVVVNLRYPAPERDPNNRFTFTIFGKAAQQPAAPAGQMMVPKQPQAAQQPTAPAGQTMVPKRPQAAQPAQGSQVMVPARPPAPKPTPKPRAEPAQAQGVVPKAVAPQTAAPQTAAPRAAAPDTAQPVSPADAVRALPAGVSAAPVSPPPPPSLKPDLTPRAEVYTADTVEGTDAPSVSDAATRIEPAEEVGAPLVLDVAVGPDEADVADAPAVADVASGMEAVEAADPAAVAEPVRPARVALPIANPTLSVWFAAILVEGAELFFRSGTEFRLPPNTSIAPDDDSQIIRFHWDATKVPGTAGVVWQVSRLPFPPDTSPAVDPFAPQGLVLSGYGEGVLGSFEVNFAPLAEGLGLSRSADAGVSEPGSISVRLPELDFVPNTLIPMKPSAVLEHLGLAEPAEARPDRSAALGVAVAAKPFVYGPGMTDFVARGGRVPFFVRALPADGPDEPRMVGTPTNVGEVLYGERPPQQSPFSRIEWVPNPEDAPQISLTQVVYKPYRSDSRWPPGCKVYRGEGGGGFNPFKFLVSLWDWASGAFDKVKSFAVDIVLKAIPVLPRGLVEVALEAALMSAGIPPDIPNLDELIDQGAGYLAKAAAEQLVGPAVGEITDELAAEVLGPGVAAAVAQQGPDALKRRVQEETEKRVKKGLEDAAQQAREELSKNAGKTWCETKHYKPVLELTVRNRTAEYYDDIWLSYGFDNEVFKGRTLPFDLGPHETLQIATPLSPDLWRVAGTHGVSLFDAMDKHFEIYAREPSALSVQGPSEPLGCYRWPDGSLNEMFGCTYDTSPASLKKGLQYKSPDRLWTDAFIATF